MSTDTPMRKVIIAARATDLSSGRVFPWRLVLECDHTVEVRSRKAPEQVECSKCAEGLPPDVLNSPPSELKEKIGRLYGWQLKKLAGPESPS